MHEYVLTYVIRRIDAVCVYGQASCTGWILCTEWACALLKLVDLLMMKPWLAAECMVMSTRTAI
jgi:hypothetical protein